MRSRATPVVLLVLALLPALAVEPQAPPDPPPFQNLQVLPDDIPRQELVDTMKGFTRALGVRCNHCHVGQGDDLSTYDFPSDAKHEKRSARVMMEMVRAINGEYLPRLEHDHGEHGEAHAHDHAAGHAAEHAAPPASARVTCMTCHRGQPTPQVESAPPPAEPAPEAPQPEG
ncbi:MAG TPA: c-type cytochrome [Thermoanaerobaculia bacterium]|nr:c-type cytochrome [Thermoanaerobaculia bacterium]